VLTRNGNEMERVRALERYRILDSFSRNPRSSGSPRWAAEIFCAPVALISLCPFRARLVQIPLGHQDEGDPTERLVLLGSDLRRTGTGDSGHCTRPADSGSRRGWKDTASMPEPRSAHSTATTSALCVCSIPSPRHDLDGIQEPGPARPCGDHSRRDGATQNGDRTPGTRWKSRSGCGQLSVPALA